MGIPLSSNFDLNAGLPLDSRVVVADLTARDAIATIQRFDGLLVYVVSNNTNYQLQGGVTNTDWEVVGENLTYNFAYSLNEDSLGNVSLDNDEATPGNDYYYGTDETGTKGYHPLPEQLVFNFEGSIDEDSVGNVSLVGDEDSPGANSVYGTDENGIKGWVDDVVRAKGTPTLNAVATWFDANHIETFPSDERPNGTPLIWDGGSLYLGEDYGGIYLSYIYPNAGVTAVTISSRLNVSGHLYLPTGTTRHKKIIASSASNLTDIFSIEVTYGSLGGTYIRMYPPSYLSTLGYKGKLRIENFSMPDNPEDGLGGIDIEVQRTWSEIRIGYNSQGLTIRATTATFYVKVFLPASTADTSQLNIPQGITPSAPVNGDVWTTSAGMFARINGATKALAEEFQTATFANPLNIDCTTIKDWICTITGDCTVNLTNTSNGDAGMLELILDGSPHTITLGTGFDKKMGSQNLVMTAGADNVISWRRAGASVIYTIGVIE